MCYHYCYVITSYSIHYTKLYEPEFLFKAMIAGNIDKMETLGAYEIAPEDVALCEYVCTSKLPLQLIVRNALDNMKKELE